MWATVILLAILATVVWIDTYQLNRDINSQASNGTVSNGTIPELQDERPSSTPSINQPSRFVPILTYHYIRDYSDQNDQLGIQLSVAPSTFDLQMSTLKNAGYQTVSLQQLAQGSYPSKAVVITFDDGYQDQYLNALPVLKKYNYIATFFIVGSFVNRPSYMNTYQVSQLSTNGMEVGGHTMNHINLANAQYLKAYTEISQSLVGRDPVFAYPSGKYSNASINILRSLGVKAAVTTNIGVATNKSDLLLLPRISIRNTTKVIDLINQEIKVAKTGSRPSPTPTSSQ